ncbi:MAG: SIS domain-containing protein, partial [Patescibacteria group bacterium]|nr:SIS domain-containing protein [Patescibacteria group bacterium]
MASVDNLSEIQKLDPDNILRNTQEFPEQCERCWDDFKKFPLPTGFIQAKSVLLCGMGGSGIGGAISASLAKFAEIPIMTSADYDIPGFVSKDTLVIITSYSGNTEETVSSYKKAAEKTNKIIVISTGGKVASLSTNYRHPHYKINYGSEPRAALGYTLTSILAIFAKLNIIELKDDDFREAIILLKGLQKKI